METNKKRRTWPTPHVPVTPQYPITTDIFAKAKPESLGEDSIIQLMNSILSSSIGSSVNPLEYCKKTYGLTYHEEGYFTLPRGKVKIFFSNGKFRGE
jgi:hypothetical protein